MPAKPKKILVVDDDFYQRDLYKEIFTDNGFEVIPGNDGQDAWEKLQKTQIDLLFTGIDMPNMDGFTLLNKFRENKANTTIPVIIFSHLGRSEDRMKAKEFLNVYFMVKGYDNPASILKKVQDLLKDEVNITAEGPPLASPDEDDRQGVTMI